MDERTLLRVLKKVQVKETIKKCRESKESVQVKSLDSWWSEMMTSTKGFLRSYMSVSRQR